MKEKKGAQVPQFECRRADKLDEGDDDGEGDDGRCVEASGTAGLASLSTGTPDGPAPGSAPDSRVFSTSCLSASVTETIPAPAPARIASSNPGGGSFGSSDVPPAANAHAAGPYGRPNRSGASRAVMVRICSGVSPPRGTRNSARVSVCGSGAEIERVDTESEGSEGEVSACRDPVVLFIEADVDPRCEFLSAHGREHADSVRVRAKVETKLRVLVLLLTRVWRLLRECDMNGYLRKLNRELESPVVEPVESSGTVFGTTTEDTSIPATATS